MTPTHFYNGGEHGPNYGDAEFISEWSDKLPIRMQWEVKDRDTEIYQELRLSDPSNCRYRVNSWLRKTVEKNKPSSNGLPF